MKTKNVSRLLILATAIALTAPMVYAQTTMNGANYNESSSSTLNGALNSGNMNSSGDINANGSAEVMGDDTMTPGVPNTGAGGESTMNFLVLFFSGLGMIASIVLLGRKLAR